MQSMTLEQLRTASEAGGVSGVTLKGEGGSFFVQIATRNGSGAVLSKARSREPRRFGNPAAALNVLRDNPAAALNVLRDVGITTGQFDASEWNPSEREPVARSNDSRALALRKAHEAAAYNEWLAAEIHETVDDIRPSISHDAVMAEMAAEIAALEAEQKPVGRRRA
jgi:hypothetical protein